MKPWFTPACLLAMLCALMATAARAQIPTYRAANNATISMAPVFRAATSSNAPLVVRASANANGSTVISPPATATLAITKPAGTALNDALIASIAVSPSTATITPPSGWTLVRRTDNPAVLPDNSNALAVYHKTATNLEPANYAFVIGIPVAGTVNRVGAITAFVDVDPVTPIDVENGQATPSALTHATPSITTTVANAMVVTNHTLSSATTWTAPAGMTEIVDARTGTAPAGQSMERAWATQAVAGASGTKTATALTAANADAGVTHILALRPAASGVSILKPAGTATNDRMIASIGIAWSGLVAPVVTPPAGWTLVRQIDNNNVTRNSLAVFHKAAAAGEPANYFFGVTNGAYIVGGMQSFYNVNAATPIHVENGQITASGTAHATPSVITILDNTLLVTSHTYASSRNWTAPAGMVEAFDRPSGANNAVGQSIEGAWTVQQVAGATGAKSATAAGNADVGATHILALAPGPLPSLTITKPAGTVANDVLIASVGVAWRAAVAPVVTPPTGWTLVRRMDNAAATANSLLVYYKAAGAAEPANYSWTFTETSFATGGILGFYNVSPSAPIHIENGQNTASGTAHATPSVTTTVANTMLVTSHTVASSGTWTPPTGMTERVDQRAPPTANAVGQAIEIANVLQAAAGATGAKSATTAATTDRGNAHILALAPGTAGPNHVELVHNGSAVTCTPRAITVRACTTAASCEGVPASYYVGTFPITMTAIAGANWCSDSLCATALASPATVSNGSTIYLREPTVRTDRMAGTASTATTTVIQCSNTLTPAAMNATTECDIAYADSGFIFDVPHHRAEAGQAVNVSAVKKSDSSLACVPAFAATKSVNFKCSYTNPTGGTRAVRVGGVALNAGNNAGAACDGTGGNVSLAFNASGIAATTVTYADVGSINLSATYAGSGADAGLSMTGSDSFIAAPNDFSVATTGPYTAGTAFAATVTARNSAGAATPNFGQETTAANVTLTSSNPVPGLGNATAISTSASGFAAGVSSTNLTWNEVGTIDLGASVADYLSSGLGVSGSLAGVGSFKPAYFDTFVTSACGTFTYAGLVAPLLAGQPFTVEVKAKRSGGDATDGTNTANYAGATWAKAVTLSDVGGGTGTLINGSLVATDFTAGKASRADLSYRFTSKTTAPYTATIRAVDADSVSSSGHAEGTAPLRSGRLRLANAVGSPLLARAIPAETQYYNGSYWTINALDSCSTTGWSVSPAGSNPLQGSDASGSTTGTLGGSVASGVVTFSASAPGSGGFGYRDFSVTVPDYLKFPWGGGANLSPGARASFGIHRGNYRVIDRRERY